MSKQASDGINYKVMTAITPGATELAINGFILTVDSTVTLVDQDSNTITLFPFKGGVEYHIKASQITAVTSGTCYGLT